MVLRECVIPGPESRRVSCRAFSNDSTGWKSSHGRTLEGTGIGLALVQELVKLHSGSIAVESEIGRGTTFTVGIPLGTAHLPADRIAAGRALDPTAIRVKPIHHGGGQVVAGGSGTSHGRSRR